MDDDGLPAETGEDTESLTGSEGFLEGFTVQEMMNSSIEAMMHDENEEARQSMERKRKEHSKEVVKTNDAKSPDHVVQKKPRFIWTTEVHNQFLEAVRELGITKAVPTKILALMNVKGLTRENVASHLQKFRLHLRKKHRDMREGCALPDQGRKNRSSGRCGISGNSRRSLVLPHVVAMHARGECACFVQPQPVSSLSNQFGVYPFIQEVSHTPFKDMLSEKGVQGICGGGELEHGFYYGNYPYGSGELAFSGPLPPNPLVDSYGCSFLHGLDDVSIVDRGITSPSVNQNMEIFSGAVQSPRLLAGEFVEPPRHGGLDGGVVQSPRCGRLRGGVSLSPRRGGLRGGAVHFPMETPGLGVGAAHSPVEVPGLGGGAFQCSVEEVPGHGWGALRFPVEAPVLAEGGVKCPVEAPVLAGGGVKCPVEAPVLARGGVKCPVEAPVLAGGSMECPVEAPELAGGDVKFQVDVGLVPENHLEDGNGDSNAYQPMLDAEEEFFSFNAGSESPFNWSNFVQDLDDTSIDDLFR